MYTVFGCGSQWQCCLGMFNDGIKRSIMALNWIFDWRIRNKQNSISYSNVSHVRMYRKLRLNAWHKAINNIKILSGGHQSKKGKAELFSPPLPKTCKQGHSFWLAVQLNMGFRVWFLYPTPDDYALGPLVQLFYWLANQSHVFRGLDPHKRRFWKEQRGRLKSWFSSER